MDEVHPREAYKALTLMDLYELRAWEQIVDTGNCGCEVRFPTWEDASENFNERFAWNQPRNIRQRSGTSGSSATSCATRSGHLRSSGQLVMGVVSWMVGTADGFLVDAAESQFGAVASNTGTIVLLMVTLSLIGVCINMAFQFRSMDGASFFWYLIKLTLIGLFAFNWANFNAVANAVIGGLDYVAGRSVSSLAGAGQAQPISRESSTT